MLVINKTIAIVVFHQKKKESMSLFATKIIKKITAMGLETAIWVTTSKFAMNTEEKHPIYGKNKGASFSLSDFFFLCFGLGSGEERREKLI